MTSGTGANEITLTRVYDAPLAMVWEAWVDPEQAAKWWGPRGFTLTTHHKDLRPGGTWVYTMHGPDGTDYPNFTRYLEVEPQALLVYDHGASDADASPLFRVTARFSEVEGRTKIEMTMTLPTPEAADQTRRFIKEVGGNSTWDRLAEFLAAEATSRELFVINRSFAAPIETVFEAWTDPTHFARWLPPTGFTMEFRRVDIRPGGGGFYLMTDGKGTTMYGRVAYREIRRPDRLVYTQQFCDEHENVSRHPMVPIWPETMLTTVALAAEGPDQTRVTVTWEPDGEVSAEELAVFRGMRGSMTQGWTGSFDKLEAYLSGAPAAVAG